MIQPAVVEHHVHDDLHVFVVHHIDQALIVIDGAIAGIDFIKIRDGVPVIGIRRHIVFEQRIDPDGSCSEIMNVIKMVDNALDIPAVTAVVDAAVRNFAHTGLCVV